MKAKPKGRKYAGLYARGGSIHLRQQTDRKRTWKRLKTDDWDLAAQLRDRLNDRGGLVAVRSMPTFGEVADQYLEGGLEHLAGTSRDDARALLKAGGPLDFLRDRKLDTITPVVLDDWWHSVKAARGAGKGKPLGRRTKLNRLNNGVAVVFRFAIRKGHVDSSPAPIFRERVRSETRTKKGRAAQARQIVAVESLDDLQTLVDAAKVVADRKGTLASARRYVAVLLCLDAALRPEEAQGLSWKGVEDRHLHVTDVLARGKHAEVTKSGRSRRVQLSRRLRIALAELRLRAGKPGKDDRVVGTLSGSNFRRDFWDAVLAEAAIGDYTLANLRSSSASWLFTLGFREDWISRQLGHATVELTRKHYARWVVADDDYRPEPVLAEGEVPADRLTVASKVASSEKEGRRRTL